MQWAEEWSPIYSCACVYACVYIYVHISTSPLLHKMAQNNAQFPGSCHAIYIYIHTTSTYLGINLPTSSVGGLRWVSTTRGQTEPAHTTLSCTGSSNHPSPILAASETAPHLAGWGTAALSLLITQARSISHPWGKEIKHIVPYTPFQFNSIPYKLGFGEEEIMGEAAFQQVSCKRGMQVWGCQKRLIRNHTGFLCLVQTSKKKVGTTVKCQMAENLEGTNKKQGSSQRREKKMQLKSTRAQTHTNSSPPLSVQDREHGCLSKHVCQ